jgi:CHASE3 domain sensor protein
METNNNEVLEQKNDEEVKETSQEIQDGIQNNVNEEVKETSQEIQEGTQNNVNEEPKEVKGSKGPMKWILISLGVIVLLLSCAFAVTVGIQSNEDKFLSLIINKQLLSDVAEEMEQLTEGSKQINSKVSLNVDPLLKNVLTDEVKIGEVALNSKTLKDNKNYYGILSLAVAGKEMTKLEYGVSNNSFGVRVADLYEKFITIQNKDIDKLAEKFTGSSSQMPNRILTEDDILAAVKLREPDLKIMWAKYENAIADAIRGKVVVEKNVELNIGGNTIKTTVYKLDINQTVAEDISLNVLKQLKNDKKNLTLLRNDLCSLLELYEDAGYQLETTADDIPEIDELIKDINDAYNDLKEQIDNRDEESDEEMLMSVTIYVNNGKVVMNEISSEEQDVTISLGALKMKNNYFIDFNVESEDGIVKLAYSGDKETNGGSTLVNGKLAIKLDDGYSKFESDIINIETEFMKNSDLEFIELNDNNSYILNGKDVKEIEQELSKVEEKLPKFVENITNSFKDAIGESNYNKLIELMQDNNSSYNYDDSEYDYNSSTYDDTEYDYNNNTYDDTYMDYNSNYDLKENSATY